MDKMTAQMFALYLGQKYISNIEGCERGAVVGIDLNDACDFITLEFNDVHNPGETIAMPTNRLGDVKLILRRHSSITEKEIAEWEKIGRPVVEKESWETHAYHWSKRLNFYRSIGIDCDGLINAGLAYDLNKLVDANLAIDANKAE